MPQIGHDNYLTIKELEERAAQYAQVEQATHTHDQQTDWVIFQLEKEQFTINLHEIDEITVVTRGRR